jgi:CHAT domain-containing protein
MPGRSLVLLAALMLCSLYHSGYNGAPVDPVLELYQKADRLFNLDNPTDASDSIALLTFRQVIQLLEKKPVDSLLFQSWLKTGVLLDVKLRFDEAKQAYLKAIGAHAKGKPLTDSVLFLPCVYAGTAYYHLNNFDSADYFLLQAESIGNNYPRVPEKDRLYNALGAMYYENGNYVQSRNYFNRALEIIRADRPSDRESAIHFEGNIAASYYRLGLYEQSLRQYEKLLTQRLYTSQISINMGKAYTLVGNYAAAMNCFRRVDPMELPGVYNDMANAQLLANKPDSAAHYLDIFSNAWEKNIGRFSKLDLGVNYIYRSDLLNKNEQFLQSVNLLQKAITIFSGNFNNEDINSNPADFAGSFASYKLFDALFRKAVTFELLYKKEPKKDYLLAAYDTYQHTISLLRYIEKSYDTDDAKIFLKKNSQQVYNNAFLLCMRLDEMEGAKSRKNYLYEAFILTEKNKASVMASRLTENRLKKMRGIDPALMQQERNIKYNIARLNIKTESTQDKTQLETIEREKENYEIELSRLQKKIEQNSSYYKLKYSDSFPGVQDVQKFIGERQAVICFYSLGNDLHIFTIKKGEFQYTRSAGLQNTKRLTQEWIEQLRATESGRRFRGAAIGEQLRDELIVTLKQHARDKEEWILIPDDIFHYLPFESLPDLDGKLLLENHAISYHFSTRFLIPQEAKAPQHSAMNILSMAPFASQGFQPMDRLPASATEIAGLPGKQFIDNKATKDQFLLDLNRYPIVHLATHAVADINNSSGSYIAFYPNHKVASEDNLYLDELYGLNMDSTDLVIISACETGTGQLIGSEGVISLSRGFTYAGCNSVINSLWKADDQATASILKRFHEYLQKGYDKSKALQQAKLDYIKSDAVHKTPDYWAHLMLIGDTKKIVVEKKSAAGLWLILGPSAALIIVLAIYLRGRNKKRKVDEV